MPRQSMIFTALAVFTVIAASVAAVPAGAETRAGEVKVSFVKDKVVDDAGVIKPEMRKALTDLFTVLEEKTGAEMAVLTVKKTAPYTIEEYTAAVFDKWGMGNTAAGKGLLFVLAVDDTKMRVKVSAGLEKNVDKERVRVVMEEIILPWVRKAEYSKGIVNGMVTFSQFICAGEGVDWKEVRKDGEKLTVIKEENARRRTRQILSAAVLFLTLGFLGVLVYNARRKKG